MEIAVEDGLRIIKRENKVFLNTLLLRNTLNVR